MIGTFDEDQLLRFGHGGKQRFEVLARTKGIVAALNEELRLAATTKIRSIVVVDRKAECDEAGYAIVLASHPQADPGTKAEPGQNDWLSRILSGKVVERRTDVLLLADSLVVFSLAFAGTPKIETQHSCPPSMERPGRLINDLVVHRAAE